MSKDSYDDEDGYGAECHCQEPRFATPEEEEWINNEIGSCEIMTASCKDDTDDKRKHPAGIALFEKLGVKICIILSGDLYTDVDAATIAKTMAQDFRAFYIRTRLAPILMMDDEALES